MQRLLLGLMFTTILLPSPFLFAQATRSTSSPSPTALTDFQEGTESLRAGQPTHAVEKFQQVINEAPRFAEAYLNLGLALSQLKRDEEAAKALEEGLKIKPSLRGAHLFLAISEYRLNRFTQASLNIRKETALSPKDAQAWMWQGIVDLAQEHFTLAVEDLDRASLIDPSNVDILYHRGRAALALSRQSYEAMFKIDPKSWHVYQVVAEADVESGNDVDAVEQFKLAIAAAPAQSGLYEALGSSYWRIAKYQEAQDAYEQAIKLDPNDMLTLYKLGCLRIDRSDAEGGKALLERVAASDPTLIMTNYYLGRAELQLGNNQAAVEDFQKSIREDKDEDTTKQAYFQLSRAYRRLHDTPDAQAAEKQYRMLEQQGKQALQDRMSRRQLRADRDASIPQQAEDKQPTTF